MNGEPELMNGQLSALAGFVFSAIGGQIEIRLRSYISIDYVSEYLYNYHHQLDISPLKQSLETG